MGTLLWLLCGEHKGLWERVEVFGVVGGLRIHVGKTKHVVQKHPAEILAFAMTTTPPQGWEHFPRRACSYWT